ncbi:MAG: tRNA (adenosine(37)-N6)-dimethylallyltransferase MiaA [Planctomycetales bacterium]|nr:tRNA (adenosine(37)-N6)-dimethylallyltransferase MiaA [Planctomycetales bacterium]
MSSPTATNCWFLTGPTAAGKTKVGLELAERIGAEIVSLDSMTLYIGMDIGTAKPTAEDRARVPHHLLDLVPPTDDFSLAEYLDAAHEKINDIKSRGKEVLFVGGTALYLKSLLRGVYQGPPPDWEFREAIEKELEVVGLSELHKRLQVIDPLLAAKLHPNDKRRIIRALEVFRVTGEPLSHRQTHFDEGRTASQCKVFVLSWTREEIHQRIDARVDAMFAAGLVEEVRRLLASYGSLSRTASQAVGYREVMDHLAAPASPSNSLAACIELVKARTRQFARRQETWFRGLPECTFVPQSADKGPAEVAASILHLLESQPTAS